MTRSYEIRTIKPIKFNEQITFLYGTHCNIDLFVEYGFVLSSNYFNRLNIEQELRQILSDRQIEILKTFNYWNSLEFYPDRNDLSWTIVKALELAQNEHQWSHFDEPISLDQRNFQQLLTIVRQNIDEDFQQWTSDHFNHEKNIFYQDFNRILHCTSIAFDKYRQQI